MWQKTSFFIAFLFLGLSCRQKTTSNTTNILYPVSTEVGTAVDSSSGLAYPVPYDTLYRLDNKWKDRWLQEQCAFSDNLLSPELTFPANWRADRLRGLPQQVKDDFFTLGYLQGQYSLLKGFDLATPMAYQLFLPPNRLPEPYYLKDFHVFEEQTMVALLLGQETADDFKPAIWFPELDSIHIWDELHASHDWLVLPDQDEIITQDPIARLLWRIDLQTGKTDRLASLPVDHGRFKLCGTLGQEYLLQRQARQQPEQFWKVSQTSQSLLFELTPAPFKWLGSQGGLHYFLSDYKTGYKSIFAARANSTFRNLLDTLNTSVVDAILVKEGIYTLQDSMGYGKISYWTLDGQLRTQYHLPAALQQLDLQFYPETETLLVRQIDPVAGIRYLTINSAYKQKVEIVHETLLNKPALPLKRIWYHIKSYDGTEIPVCMIYRSDLTKLTRAASLFIPMPEAPEDLLHSQADLALSQRLLKRGGILLFVFSRGNRRLGKAWHQRGTGPRLQLAYDDLQAALSYCNTQQIGSPTNRSIWAVKEQALSGAALLIQRPELSKKIFLDQGYYDLRPDRQNSNAGCFEPWWLYQDSIPNRLIRQYSPHLAPIATNIGPKTMVQSTNPYIFDPAAIFLTRLQKEMPYEAKLWMPYHNIPTKRADTKRKVREAGLNAFFFDPGSGILPINR